MDSPHLVNRGAVLPQGSRSSKGGDSAQRGGASGGASSASTVGSGTVLALLDAASRQRYLGSGQSYRQQGEAKEEPSAPASKVTGSASPSGAASGPTVDPGAREVTEQFQQNFAETASDHDQFHELMRQSFGENYDYAAAEQIRNQTLAGDFSWMPDVQVVDPETLVDESGRQTGGTALGAYSAETDTIYISSDVLENDPARALEIMTEEVGHGLDARLNESDSAGDEGDIFARLMAGDDLSQEELDALRAENDSGTITIDGKEIEVEYGCNPIKAFVDFVTAPFQAIMSMVEASMDALGELWEAVKDAVVKVLNSPIFNALLLICSFIPVLNTVVLVIQIIKAVYMIAQGIKHGSMAMVLGGIASLATGVGNLGAAMGASAKFIETANKVADWANAAAKTYQAASEKDFAAAFSILSDTFTGTDAGTAFGYASDAYCTYEAIDSGDVLGAMSIGSELLGDLTTGDTAEFFKSVDGHTETIGTVIEAVRTGDYSAAAGILVANYGDNLGLSADQQERVVKIAGTLELVDGARQMIEDGNYAGAAMALYAAAEEYGVGEKAGEALLEAAETVSKIADLAMLVERGEYGEAIALGASILDSDPSPEMQARVDKLVAQAERVEGVIEAIETGDYTVALGLIAEGLGSPLDAKQKETLTKLETRVEAAITLKEAVESGDVSLALDSLETVTGIELPPEIGAGVEMAENAVELVGDIKAAIDDGDYALAAELIGTLAAGFGDEKLASSVGEFAGTVAQLTELAELVDNGEYGEAIALGASIMDANPSPEMRQLVDKLVGQAERVEDVVAAIDAGDYTLALGLIAEGMGAPLDAKTKDTLANLETRIEAGVALKEAIEKGEVADAVAALEALTGIELPKVAERLQGLESVAEQIADVKVAVETGQYVEAAELAASIADGLEDKQLAQSLRAFAALLDQLGFPRAPSDGSNTARA